jgi:hypothetical protein
LASSSVKVWTVGKNCGTEMNGTRAATVMLRLGFKPPASRFGM